MAGSAVPAARDRVGTGQRRALMARLAAGPPGCSAPRLIVAVGPGRISTHIPETEYGASGSDRGERLDARTR